MSATLHGRDMRRRLARVLLVAGLFVPPFVHAGDIEDVMVPLQAYLDGHATGEERHFRRAFAPDGMLVGTKDGRYGQRSAQEYIKASSSGRVPTDEALRRRWIHSITVTGQVATAVIELDYPDMRAHDHMSLVKFPDGWRIVVKAYDAFTPATTGSGMRETARGTQGYDGRHGR